MAYKVWFEFRGGEFATNGIVLATRDEAIGYATDKLMFWYMPVGFEVREEKRETVNYSWSAEKGVQYVG